jgi:hypothetical protein
MAASVTNVAGVPDRPAPFEARRALRSWKATEGIHCREFVMRDPSRSNQRWRCMPRWRMLESGTTRGRCEEYERQELSRRAERRRMAGTPATRSQGPAAAFALCASASKKAGRYVQTKAGSEEQEPAYDPRRV